MNRFAALMMVTIISVISTRAEAAQSAKGPVNQPDAAATDVRSFIGVNNLQMMVSNVGTFAFDPSSYFGKNDGLYFPRGSDKSVIFAAGLWMGAKVNGSPRMAIAEYSTEYTPGGMKDGTYQSDQAGFHVYKVSRGDDASNPDYASWPFEDGAPVRKNSVGEDSVDADGYRVPLITGDQTLYAVYNDADLSAHTNGAGSTLPLGIEVHQYVFAFARGGSLGNTIYLVYGIINKGENLLEDAYVSLWCDPDVGDAFDDFVGCDTALSLGYAYNEGDDPIYGEGAPAVGFDFLQGPIVPSPGDSARFNNDWRHGFRNLPMTSFNKYINGNEPRNAVETYNYMQGLLRNGDPVIDPTTEMQTYFQVPGDPVTGEGWLDAAAEDRRYMMSAGPFTMAPGDTQIVITAVLVGQGTDPLSSITALKAVDQQVQSVFDLGFDIPFPPPQPQVWAQPLENRIDLVWDATAEGDVQESSALGQRFVMEGYNVYQGESPSGPWKKIATFDVENDVTRIYQDQFDPQLGAVQRLLTQNGTNSGLHNHMMLTTDLIGGSKLINHWPYYYAVTAYSYDELNLEEYLVGANPVGHLTEVLETRVEAVRVVPNSIALALSDTADHVAGSSEGQVEIQILEPGQLTGHEYEVTFNEDFTWNLDDVTLGSRVLDNLAQSTGTYTDPLVDGMMVQVWGPPPGIKDVAWSGSDDPWVSGVNWGGYYFDGSVDEGCYFFGSSICDPTRLPTVELRFSESATQKGYRYLRGATPSYPYSGYGTMPFTAWDVSQDPPRQLNVCFVEQFELASADNQWLPPDGVEDGGREYVFILNSTYSAEEDTFYTSRSIFHNAEEFDVLYAWWPVVAEGHSNSELAEGQVLTFNVNKINTAADRFTFAPQRAGDDELRAGATLANVYAVPNPYFHRANLPASEEDRVITFIDLPALDATIEIYNLAGERIRTLGKEQLIDGDIHWDVLCENGLPPSSGVYIYRVLSPGLEPRVGKLAIFIERERLRQF